MDTYKKKLLEYYRVSSNKEKTDLVIDILFMLQNYKVVESDVLNNQKKVYEYLIELLDDDDTKILLEKYYILSLN